MIGTQLYAVYVLGAHVFQVLLDEHGIDWHELAHRRNMQTNVRH